MKKVTDFIVSKRYIVLFVFIILTVLSLIVSNKVVINYDIAKYLPGTSDTRIGMDIMEDEFDSNTSTLNIMVKDLSSSEKQEAYEYLNNLYDISDIEYDDSENYNKENYTLYVLTIDAAADSKKAKEVYEIIEDYFGDKLVDTSGDVSDHNKDVLPFYIIVLAVVSALIILIIMCESYVEPFLFLITILIAVALNKGTNIIFDNVSNITNSIAAILQMALSMDYSIMLINRYRQERETENDKEKAMKKALYHAFKSISSSSITTIVGLLALVFMSFTIGRDLGIVLAKGVLLSLLSIFSCLPALILMFDSAIQKTKKKSPIFELKLLGKLAYKCRYIVLVIFIIIFIVSYFLKGNLGILYTNRGTDKVDEVFSLNNQMAIIYNNKYEDVIKDYCLSLENNEKIDEVLCYGNTINLKLKYNKLNSKLKDLGSDVEVDDYLLKIVYYHYYNSKEDNKIELENLIKFIKNTVYDNENMSKNIDNETKNNIDRLLKFVDLNEVNKKRSSEEIASVLNISKDKVDDLLVYYNSKNSNNKMTITQFINFMNDVVLKDKKYASSIDDNTKNNLNKISKFIDKNLINKKLSSSEMAKLFGMNEKLVSDLYTYYLSNSNMDNKLSINEFSDFIINYVFTNDKYSNLFNEESKNNILLINKFSNNELINKSLSSSQLASLLGMNETDVQKIFILIFGSQDNGDEHTISEFVNKVSYLQQLHYLDDIDVSGIISLSQNNELMNSQEKYTATSLAEFLQVDKESIYYLYALINVLDGKSSSWTLSPYQFINSIVNNDSIRSMIDSSSLQKLGMLNSIMTSTINNVMYNYEEMSANLSINQSDVKNIYSLYFANNLNISPYQFVNFILEHQNDEALKNNLTKNNLNELILLKTIMNSVLNNEYYSKDELSKLLNIDKNDLALLYSLYDVEIKNTKIKVSFKDFVYFLVNDVMNQKEYTNSFDNETRNKLKTVNTIINNSLNNKKYNKNELYQLLSKLTKNLNKDLIDLVYIYYGSEKNYDDSYELTIEEFVNYLNNDILNDKRFDDYIDSEMKNNILDAKDIIKDAKDLLIGDNYSRVVLNTKFEPESKETFNFIKNVKEELEQYSDDLYIIGDSPMAYEMSQTFDNELNLITILTMIFIFVVVMFTFKSILIPVVLVLLIQCAVFLTMGILSFGGSVYFISILIVQSILMGATIDYAILYTSYYLEERQKMGIKEAIISSYNNSMHTILTSASILVIVTLIVGNFASAVAAKICLTLSEGCLCSTILIILLLPAVLASIDKFIIKNKKIKK